MFPAMVSGENPLLVAPVGSSAIIFVVLYTAHGCRVRTTAALVGTLFGLLPLAFAQILQGQLPEPRDRDLCSQELRACPRCC